MAQSNLSELEVAWRALAENSSGEGWRTIVVANRLPISVRAGRHFPGNEEALLFSFRSDLVPSPDRMPSGRGFVVGEVKLSGGEAYGRVWMGIRRMQSGSPELFSRMAADLLDVLGRLQGAGEPILVKALIQRVRAWQEFMSRSSIETLTSEEEVGLFGELQLLHRLLQSGLDPAIAIAAWEGPLGGVHDFLSKSFAIEVKATLASGGFRVRISSVEQLDSLVFENIHLFAVRLVLDEKGLTLPEQIGRLYELVEPSDQVSLENRVLAAGYRVGAEDFYSRRFSVVECLMFCVNDNFPRLSRGNVPAQVVDANYVLDVGQIRHLSVDIGGVIDDFGAQ